MVLNIEDDKWKEAREHWQKKAEGFLLGRKIEKIEWMTPHETDEIDWSSRPICLKLDNGTWIFPMRDDEGNDGGALAVSTDTVHETLPVF